LSEVCQTATLHSKISDFGVHSGKQEGQACDNGAGWEMTKLICEVPWCRSILIRRYRISIFAKRGGPFRHSASDNGLL